MKYTAAMFFGTKKDLFLTLELGTFDTMEDAKSTIEKHKETIYINEYGMEAEYNIHAVKNEHDDEPELVYECTVSNKEEDEICILENYVTDTTTTIDNVAEAFGIDITNELGLILDNLIDEYHNNQSESIINEYRDKINSLKK